MSNYQRVIRQQLAEVRKERAIRRRCKFLGLNYDLEMAHLKAKESYHRLESNFWSEAVEDEEPCRFL